MEKDIRAMEKDIEAAEWKKQFDEPNKSAGLEFQPPERC